MKCLHCHFTAAKWQEQLAPSRTFCGFQCQSQFYAQIGVGEDDTDDDDILIKFKTTDGQIFELRKKLAKRMKTIEDLIEDATNLEDPIQLLPIVTGAAFAYLYRFLIIDTDEALIDALNEARQEFAQMPHQLFMEIMSAANYLNFAEMLDSDTLVMNLAPHLHAVGNDNLYTIFGHLLPRAISIQDAAHGGYTKVVRLLLETPQIDPANNNNEAIFQAAWMGRTGVVELLLADPRVDPTRSNNVAIRVAAERGHLGVIVLLLADPRVDLTVDNNVAIKDAARNGHLDAVKLLLPGASAADSKIIDALLNIALRHKRNPLIQYLQSYRAPKQRK